MDLIQQIFHAQNVQFLELCGFSCGFMRMLVPKKYQKSIQSAPDRRFRDMTKILHPQTPSRRPRPDASQTTSKLSQSVMQNQAPIWNRKNEDFSKMLNFKFLLF